MIRNGHLVANHTFERDYELLNRGLDQTDSQYNYYNLDWHPYYQGSGLHSLQSVTKSVTAMLVGIAIQRGELANTSEKILGYFDDYDILNLDDLKRQITIEDLLTMQAGIEWDEFTYSLDDPRNSVGELERSDDWIQFILNLPMTHQPGEVFVYSSGAAQLLSVIMQKTTGLPIDEYAEEYLFKPLGISEYFWKKTPKGWADTEGGLYLKAEDLAKLGYLVLHRGEWEGEQIISSEWVNAMLSPKVGDVFPEDPTLDWGYGYMWWLVGDTSQNGIDVYAGLGYGGQRLFVVPELDIVAVFNAWDIYTLYPSTIDLFLLQIIPTAMEN
jgi:CubicO group peptidase (beta-lactamase class C family)